MQAGPIPVINGVKNSYGAPPNGKWTIGVITPVNAVITLAHRVGTIEIDSFMVDFPANHVCFRGGGGNLLGSPPPHPTKKVTPLGLLHF